MAQIKERKPVSRGGLWLAWTLATTLGATAGLALADIPVVSMSDYNYAGDNGIGPLLMWGCGLLFLVGPLVGLAQGAVMHFFGIRINILIWTLFTSTGVLLAVLIILIPFCGMLFAGVVLGIAQYPVFGTNGGGPLWVVASGVAWLGALASGWGAYRLFTSGVGSGWPFHPVEDALRWGVGWAVGATIFGAITGFVLVRYMNIDNL